MILENFKKENLLYNAAAFSTPFIFIFLLYTILFQFSESHESYPWFDPHWGRELLKMVYSRVPHHLLFSYASLEEKISLFALILIVFSGFLSPRKFLLKLNLISLFLVFLMFLGWFFVEIYPLPIVLNLYLLRSDVLLRLLAFYFLCSRISLRNPNCFDLIPWKKLRIGIIVFSLVYFFLGPHLRFSYPKGKDVFQIGLCLQNKTPKDSLVLSSPSLKGLRLYGQRSVVASFNLTDSFFRLILQESGLGECKFFAFCLIIFPVKVLNVQNYVKRIFLIFL